MFLGPVFSVEMVTTSRRLSFLLLRNAYAIVLFTTLFMNHWMSTWYGPNLSIQQTAQLTHTFFLSYGWIQIFAVVFLGPIVVAGTIASERERRTIEYLFTTTLSNGEIVLGKLTARLLQLTGILLAGIPILSLAMLFGGIEPSLIVAVAVSTLATVFYVGAISISVSVWSARVRAAIIRCFMALALVMLLPLLMSQLIAIFSLSTTLSSGPLSVMMWALSPFAGILEISSFQGTQNLYTKVAWIIAVQLGAGLLLLLVATWGVRRAHLRAAGKAPRLSKLRMPWKRRHVAIWAKHPMLWKEMYAERSANKIGILGRLVAVVITGMVITNMLWTLWNVTNGGGWGNPSRQLGSQASWMSVSLMIAGLFVAGVRAAALVGSEKERECWETLLSTPLSARQIVWEKVLGNVFASRGLMLLLVFVWLFPLFFDAGFIIPASITAGVFFVLLLYVSSLGMMYSLRCKNSLRAMAATLFTAVFAGGAYLFCCVPFFFAGSGNSTFLFFAPCIPMLLSMPMIIYEAGAQYIEAELMVATFLGVAGYAGVTALLINGCVSGFSGLTGRMEGSSSVPRS